MALTESELVPGWMGTTVGWAASLMSIETIVSSDTVMFCATSSVTSAVKGVVESLSTTDARKDEGAYLGVEQSCSNQPVTGASVSESADNEMGDAGCHTWAVAVAVIEEAVCVTVIWAVLLPDVSVPMKKTRSQLEDTLTTVAGDEQLKVGTQIGRASCREECRSRCPPYH